MIELVYDRGTVLLRGYNGGIFPPGMLKYDHRVNGYRCLAYKYYSIVKYLKHRGIKFRDYVLDLGYCTIRRIRDFNLRGYQREALSSWLKNGCRGVIVLPTGTGKTRVALAAIGEILKPTLVVVPTIELMEQWRRAILRYFKASIGFYGGGRKEIKCITIATYDSAYINAEILGNRFMLAIFDEVHHLPSPGYRQIAELLAAPLRMGLTATPEREDQAHLDLNYLVGPIVYRRKVVEFSGKYLADFDVVTVRVKLSDVERMLYEEYMGKFRKYVESRGIKFKSIEDFRKIILESGLDVEAREALLAWHEARKIAFNAEGKIEALREILSKHRGDKIIIFTDNNEIVRRISREFLIPEITHKTSDKERRMVMEAFRRGALKTIVTSRVLEEGIDVPDASVAVILSGTGSRREFIQRLGRILRPKGGKRAVLYEVVTSKTKEVSTARRRKKEALG